MPYVDPTLIPAVPKNPITSESYTALRDNPTAIAGGEEDAPITRGGWVPYDMVEYGDGADGVIYDFSVDGAVASITSPTFVKGWEYKFIFNAVTSNLDFSDFRVYGYRVNDSAFSLLKTFTLTDYTAADGEINFYIPMQGLSRYMKFDHSLYFGSSTLTDFADHETLMTPAYTTDVTFSQARFSLVSSGSFNGGKILLYKRGFGEL